MDRIIDHLRSLACRSRTLSRQISHFLSHHCKSLAVYACSRCFNCRIQRQNIGLECNVINGLDDLGDRLGGCVDVIHSLNHGLHLVIAGCRHIFNVMYQNIRFASLRCIRLGTLCYLIHRSGYLLNSARLLGRTLCESLAGIRHLLGAYGNLGTCLFHVAQCHIVLGKQSDNRLAQHIPVTAGIRFHRQITLRNSLSNIGLHSDRLRHLCKLVKQLTQIVIVYLLAVHINITHSHLLSRLRQLRHRHCDRLDQKCTVQDGNKNSDYHYDHLQDGQSHQLCVQLQILIVRCGLHHLNQNTQVVFHFVSDKLTVRHKLIDRFLCLAFLNEVDILC